MTNHSDIAHMELLIRHIPNIKAHFNSILVECMPKNLSNEALIKQYRDLALSYLIDLKAVKVTLGLTANEVRVMQNEYQKPLSDEEKFVQKYQIIEKIRDKSGASLGVRLNMMFYNFYYLYFLIEAHKQGIQLFGIEASTYYPGIGRFNSSRDQEIVKNTIQLTEKHEKCFVVIGASHGIDLIKAYQKITSVKSAFTHIYLDSTLIDEKSESMLFKKEIEESDYKLNETQSYLYLDLSANDEKEQSDIFLDRIVSMDTDEKLYHAYPRMRCPDGSGFSTTLSRRTSLPFFATLDSKDYVADAVLEIDTLSKKTASEALKQKIGFGEFFQTERGKPIFVIQDTNEPSRSKLLQASLEKIQIKP